MKTLIVEDDESAREMVARLLRGRSHEVTVCGSVEEAQKIVKNEQFDILIMDWMLPGKTGPEFCRFLRAQVHGDEYYILLMTARDTVEDLDEALEAGANDYLVKPLELDLLRIRLRVAERQVQALAERNRSRHELRESGQRIERLALVARKTQNGVVLMDGNGIIEWTNEAFARMTRLDAARVEGCVLAQLLRSAQSEHPTETALGREGDGEIALQRLDGSHFWVYYSISALQSDSGDYHGYVCLFSDITTHKKIDEERFKASKIESLGILAGGIAHDLNNILTVISGNISLARASLGSTHEEILNHLQRADQASLRAADLSKQLLTFAKGGDPVKQVVNIGELMEKTIRFALHGSSLSCVFAIPANLWQAEIDIFQIEQVFNNLIINSREAIPQGGRIQVQARNETLEEANPFDLSPGNYVRISFSDNGPGIKAENLARIFDPYFSTKPAGSGLGLTICFSVLAKHGGRITAETQPGGGALFTLLIPAAIHPAQRIESPPATATNGQLSVLCMDDEPGIREVTMAMLTMLGYRVVTVEDGREALAAWREAAATGKAFDAVILDATIPGGMGGVATIKALLKEDPQVKAIICSGYSDESALAELKSYGFKASLPKPFTGKQLGSILSEIIGQKN